MIWNATIIWRICNVYCRNDDSIQCTMCVVMSYYTNWSVRRWIRSDYRQIKNSINNELAGIVQSTIETDYGDKLKYDMLNRNAHTTALYHSLPLQWRHNERDGVSNHRRAVVSSVVCSDADQRKHHSSASLAFVRGIYWWPVNSPHKGPVTRQLSQFDDVASHCYDSYYSSSCFIQWMLQLYCGRI